MKLVLAQGLNNLAVIYTSQGRAQEALQTLQAANLADPSYAEVTSDCLYCHAYYDLGNLLIDRIKQTRWV